MNIRNTETQVWTWEVHSQALERADVLVLRALEMKEGVCTTEGAPSELPAITRSQLKRLMEEERVTADGVFVKASQKLKNGVKIQIQFPPPLPTELVPENMPLEIIYEDEDLAVINKPQGLTVHPSLTQMESTLVHALLHHIKDLSGIGGVLRPGIVHRLDKNTSGALVITKHDLAHTRLAETFSKHKIERTYWALCYGSPKDVSTHTPKRIETLIARHPMNRKKMSAKVTEGKRAITFLSKKLDYAQPGKNPFASWIEARLETGRTHQVRVHLTDLGHSILGDTVYGVPTSSQSKWQILPKEVRDQVSLLPGQALHARVLGFKHPISGKELRFEAAPPPAFQELMDRLKKYS